MSKVSWQCRAQPYIIARLCTVWTLIILLLVCNLSSVGSLTSVCAAQLQRGHADAVLFGRRCRRSEEWRATAAAGECNSPRRQGVFLQSRGRGQQRITASVLFRGSYHSTSCYQQATRSQLFVSVCVCNVQGSQVKKKWSEHEHHLGARDSVRWESRDRNLF